LLELIFSLNRPLSHCRSELHALDSVGFWLSDGVGFKVPGKLEVAEAVGRPLLAGHRLMVAGHTGLGR
jgi:hypothetical protein